MKGGREDAARGKWAGREADEVGGGAGGAPGGGDTDGWGHPGAWSVQCCWLPPSGGGHVVVIAASRTPQARAAATHLHRRPLAPRPFSHAVACASSRWRRRGRPAAVTPLVYSWPPFGGGAYPFLWAGRGLGVGGTCGGAMAGNAHRCHGRMELAGIGVPGVLMDWGTRGGFHRHHRLCFVLAAPRSPASPRCLAVGCCPRAPVHRSPGGRAPARRGDGARSGGVHRMGCTGSVKTRVQRRQCRPQWGGRNHRAKRGVQVWGVRFSWVAACAASSITNLGLI